MKRKLLPILALLFCLFTSPAFAQSGTPCPAGCDTDPLCVMEDNCFRFEYYGAVDQGNGTTQIKFKIFNSSRYPFMHVMFELPGQNLPAVSPKLTYISRYKYSVQNVYDDSLIKFTGLNTSTYRYDQADVFRYIVDSATFHNGENSTIEVYAQAGTLVGAVTFNLEECDDMIIIPLPVELISFNGSASKEGIALNWETATEKDNAYFSIQHSTDGRNFESVGYVEGNGTSSTNHKYRFNHTQPAGGKNYYRLKQVDHDGKYAYSKVIVVESKGAPSLKLTVYPNPVTNGELNLKLDRAMNEHELATVDLHDLNGRLIATEVLKGSQTIQINTRKLNLKPGIYLVNLRNGNTTSHQKIVIQ
ncbi:T9SS type A sorting domain-containing protein [Adhaeribacter soli]|uniref:T9SS type A sorting domain-containing protein n=1 Tax=Adhaeribacter soli TaxID=2607655 RepID=A0A5N1IRA1_9BACT|nr:T9SS type A sorting domain-containing protein [Adhaeribacter soli]KAA9332695.1 T9SS type A sorting domain-containing protein [Adhaeribacter soli]